MRDLNELNKLRDCGSDVINYYGSVGDGECGVFWLRSSVDGARMRVIASSGEGWDHVSVSRKTRCPNWLEMEQAKRWFFKDDETVMQLHVPESEHINCHPYCLHLWRPTDQEIPKPPPLFVGPTEQIAVRAND